MSLEKTISMTSLARSAFLPWVNLCRRRPRPFRPCKGCSSDTNHVLCFCMTYTNPVWNIVMDKSYIWGHSINHSVIYSWRVWMSTYIWQQKGWKFGKLVRLQTQNSSYFSLSRDCAANDRELRGLNIPFNIEPRLAIFSKRSTIHITGFLGEVFESAAMDKWPEVGGQLQTGECTCIS